MLLLCRIGLWTQNHRVQHSVWTKLERHSRQVLPASWQLLSYAYMFKCYILLIVLVLYIKNKWRRLFILSIYLTFEFGFTLPNFFRSFEIVIGMQMFLPHLDRRHGKNIPAHSASTAGVKALNKRLGCISGQKEPRPYLVLFLQCYRVDCHMQFYITDNK